MAEKLQRTSSSLRNMFRRSSNKSVSSTGSSVHSEPSTPERSTARVGSLSAASTPQTKLSDIDESMIWKHGDDLKQESFNDPRYHILKERKRELEDLLEKKERRLKDVIAAEEKLMGKVAAEEVSASNYRRMTGTSRRMTRSLSIAKRPARVGSGASQAASSLSAASEQDEQDDVFGTNEADASVNMRPPTAAATREQQRRRRMSSTTVETRPASNRERRIVRLVRKQPGEKLGFTLKTVVLPKRDSLGHQSKTQTYEPTFIASVDNGGLAQSAGLYAGDQILEVDGEACHLSKHSYVVRLIQRNTGTVSLTVKYTRDYRRAVLHRRKIGLQMDLVAKINHLKELEKEERNVRVAASVVNKAADDDEAPMGFTAAEKQPASPKRVNVAYVQPTIDYCTAPIPAKATAEELIKFVKDLQAQWAGERDSAKKTEDALRQELNAAKKLHSQLKRVQDKLINAARRGSTSSKSSPVKPRKASADEEGVVFKETPEEVDAEA